MTAAVPDHAMIDPTYARQLLARVPASPSPKIWLFKGSLDGGLGWWKVTIDSEGALSILSDFGNYGNHWSRGGMGRPVLRFLLGCDDSYLLSKVSSPTWFDLDASIKRARETLVRAIRSDKQKREIEEIRQAWDALKTVSSEFEWNDWLMSVDLHDHEIWNCTSHDYSPQVLAFFKEVWPHVREQIRAEVESGQSGGFVEVAP